MADSYRTRLDALMSQERAEQASLRAQLPAALQASLPLDAVPIVAGMGFLADAVGIGEEIRSAQRAQSSANPAVLHGRVFGRGAGLTHDTVLAAFADGARVRNRLLLRLAEAIDGGPLRNEVGELLAEAPLPSEEDDADTSADERTARIARLFDAQERALALCAERLDAIAAD